MARVKRFGTNAPYVASSQGMGAFFKEGRVEMIDRDKLLLATEET